MIIEIGHPSSSEQALNAQPQGIYSGIRAMVFESVGPVRHEVSIPFHDSQVRGAALLIQTGWDQRWGTDAYWEPGPFLAEHLIFRMLRSGVRLVGVDFPVAERSSATRLVTTGQIPVVENLRDLASLPHLGLRFSVAPLVNDSLSACPVRAYVEIT